MAAILDLFPECHSSGVSLRFDLFLERLLYHPRHGYYCRPGYRFGERGDYYTAPQVHSFFAEVLSEHLLQIWEEMECPSRFVLLELGPGDGTLAFQLLASIRERFQRFHNAVRYVGLEVSKALAEQQRKKLTPFSRASIVNAKFSEANVSPFHGAIFSNEFFDALPFRRLKRGRNRWLEYFVEIQPKGLRGRWRATDWRSDFSPRIPVGRILERRDAFEDFYQFASKALKQGIMIHFDYGGTTEYLNPMGTVRTFYKHRMGEDPFVHLGEQDVTASVDFSHLVRLGEAYGFRSRLLNQRQYLIERGILEKIALRFQDPQADQVKILQEKLALKNLIVPGGISDHFKVLIQERLTS